MVTLILCSRMPFSNVGHIKRIRLHPFERRPGTVPVYQAADHFPHYISPPAMRHTYVRFQPCSWLSKHTSQAVCMEVVSIYQNSGFFKFPLTKCLNNLTVCTGCLKEKLHSGIPNVTVWRVLRKRLHLKAYKLS
jgi:hypothetical protein